MHIRFSPKAVLVAVASGGYATAQTSSVSPVQQQSPRPASSISPFIAVPRPPADQKLEFGPVLPEFEAKDVGGRTWTNESLRGKITVLYLWHTFQFGVPGPVSRDLPQLQRFYEKVKDTNSVQVLAFCTDYDYTHAKEFMAKNNFTFPVIADWTLPAKFFPKDDCRWGCSAGVPTATGHSIPIASRQWLVNAEGRLANPALSWDLDRLLLEVERIAGLK
ncbi:MAG: TlpA family protein disulfide reductase [Bryobacteraceae bacterium]|nr:TlpA family protein disulfide reductase [Bryobacteraceae bacterium]